MFDPDAGALDPIVFYFDTIPLTDWSVCFDDNGVSSWSTCSSSAVNLGPRDGPANIPIDGSWQTPVYSFVVPSDADGANQPFYGGRLYAWYSSGVNDTYSWKIEIDSRPYLVK
jgi:hypothetical protein